jgi:histone H3/H4
VPAGAAQVPRDNLQFHRDGFRKASVSETRSSDDANAAACETFNLCVEAMTNQIGHRVETLASHNNSRTL